MDHAISQKNHQKALQKNISLLTKQICTRYDKRDKISSLFFSRCKDSRLTSVIKSLINIRCEHLWCNKRFYPQKNYELIITISINFAFHSYLWFNEFHAIIFPPVNVACVYLHFITNGWRIWIWHKSNNLTNHNFRRDESG